MSAANGLIAVWLDVPAEREEEFNDWYNLEHLPQVVGLPGFIGGAPLKYLAWTEKVRSLFQNTRRSMCQRIRPSVFHQQR